MSFKPEVRTGSDPKFYGNPLRFATREEAEASARELMLRWFLVVDYRVSVCADSANYRFVDGANVPIGDDEAAQ
jgi:hypothetical protein